MSLNTFPHRLGALAVGLAATWAVTIPAYAAPTTTPSPRATTQASVAKPGLAKVQIPQVSRTTLEGRELIAALRPTTTARFTMAGVTWQRQGSVSPTVQIRTQGPNGWSQWSTLAVEPVAEDTPGPRSGTAPTFTGEATGIEVRVLVAAGQPAPADLQLTLIDPGSLPSDASPQRTRLAATTQAQSTMPAQPAVITRAAWGADESLKAQSGSSCMTPNYDQTIKAVVVHHTEGSNSYTKDQSASIVRGIYAYHVTGNGWCDIGYNFLIDRYGQIFEGRNGGITKPVHGAHAYDWNTTSMGLSIMGSFMTQTPPPEALDAAVNLAAWRLAAYYRDPKATVTIGRYTSDVISGHRQVSSTDCPGDAFFAYLPTFRDRVNALVGTAQSPIEKRWLALGGASGSAGDVYEGEQPYYGGRITRFWKSTIYERPDGGVRVMTGPILSKYESLGEAGSKLGFPVTDQNCDSTGCYQLFDFGVILWSAETGAHVNWGAIRDRYADYNFEHGELGYPTTDEVCNPTGCWQAFQRGFILFSPASGAHISRGALREKYASLDFERSFLGYPTSEEFCDASGCWQDYQGGSLVISGSRGTHFTRGLIRDRYLDLGGRRGMLGYPSTDELCGLRDGGCWQAFGDRAIYWSPATGAHENLGAIREAYGRQGWENGRLGYPTTGEICDANGCYQNFQGGRITWSPRTGAIVS